MAATNSRGKVLRAIERLRDDGIGMDAPLAMLREYIAQAERVELFPSERVVLLDIPHGELRHRCTEGEWRAFRQFLDDKQIPLVKPRWYEFWLQ
jgi:hypothetical protein